MAKRDQGTTYYEVLGVGRLAGRDVIRRAYLAEARRHHPDAGGDPARMQRVNEAWSVLSDANRRSRYDQSLTVVHRTRPAARPTWTSTVAGEEAAEDSAWVFDAAVDDLHDHDDHDDHDDHGWPVRPPSRRSAFIDTAGLVLILFLAGLTAFTLLFGALLMKGELLGFGVFLGFLTGVAVLARLLIAMRSAR